MKARTPTSTVTRSFVPFLVAVALVGVAPRASLGQTIAQTTLLEARALPDTRVEASNPRIGTWTLNLGKSSDSSEPLPSHQTRLDASSGDRVTSTIDGSAADGKRISYVSTASYYDAKDNPLTGVSTPNGADTLALKGIDDHTFETTLKRAGKVVQTTHEVISTNGRMLTVTASGTSETGLPTSSVFVYDKE